MNELPPAWLLSATGFALSMCATPGPNNVMVAASGATFGFKRTLPHMLGVAIGAPFMLVAVALGMGQLLQAIPALQTAMKWTGTIYLLWLAWNIARAKPTKAGIAATSRPLTMLQAGLFQWVNPKAWIIALGAVATYTTAEGVLGQSLLLAAIFVVVTLPAVAFWTMTGVGAARLLRTERSLRAFNLVMAALLVLSLLPLLRDLAA